MARYSKILVALDNGETRLAVARRALSIAHNNEAEVLIVHVIDSTELEQARIEIMDDIIATGQEAVERDLDRQLKRAANDTCIKSVTVEVRAGCIIDTLEDAVERYNPDLIVCGVRGLSGIKYAFLGSVSTHLTRHAPCDVLVVRPESIEDIDEAEYENTEAESE